MQNWHKIVIKRYGSGTLEENVSFEFAKMSPLGMIHRGIELSGARHNCHMSLQSQLRQEVQKAPVTKKIE